MPAIILDARTGKFDDGKRIPGAKSLHAKSTLEEVQAVLPSKNALIFTYCVNEDCPASGLLAEHLNKLGYKYVIESPQGIEGWIKAGHKVTIVKK